jgi:hypothetical protein
VLTKLGGGETANDNEIMAPAAMATPLDASSCIACIAGIVRAIRGTGMAGTAPQLVTLAPGCHVRFTPESGHFKREC